MEGAIYLIVSKRVGEWSRIIAEMELASFSHLTETGNTSLGQCCSRVAGVAARGCNASFNLFRIMRSSMLPYPSSTEPWVELGRDWWRRKSEAAQHNNHYNWMQPVSPLDASLCLVQNPDRETFQFTSINNPFIKPQLAMHSSFVILVPTYSTSYAWNNHE